MVEWPTRPCGRSTAVARFLGFTRGRCTRGHAGARTTSDGLPPVGGIDGSAGSGGAIGTGGVDGSRWHDGRSGAQPEAVGVGTAHRARTTIATEQRTTRKPRARRAARQQPGMQHGRSRDLKAGTQSCELAADHQALASEPAFKTSPRAQACPSSKDNDSTDGGQYRINLLTVCCGQTPPDLARPGCSAFAQPVRRRVSCRVTNLPEHGEPAARGHPRAPRPAPIPGLTIDCDSIVDNLPVAVCNVEGKRLGA